MSTTAPTPAAWMIDPDALVSAAFSTPRTPRSPEYKAGILALLRRRCGQAEDCTCPYREGTAAADAWYAGISEGHSLFRKATLPL